MKSLTIIALGLLVGVGAHASPLNLQPQYPDFVLASDQVYQFDAASRTLTVNGTVAGYAEMEGDSNDFVINDSFSMSVSFDAAGNVLAGSFLLTGTVLDSQTFAILYDAPGGDGLLGGDFDLFGFHATGDSSAVLEFTFDNASGLIATDTPLGQLMEGGMVMTVNSPVPFDFANDILTLDWEGTGAGDVFVPIPAGAWLFGSALLGLAAVARRRRRPSA